MTNDFQLFLRNNNHRVDRDFTQCTLDEKIDWYNFLKETAASDLSFAHCLQHTQSARYSVQLSDNQDLKKLLADQPYHMMIGSNSVKKIHDTCIVIQGMLHGDKNYVSNLGFADFHVLWMHNQDRKVDQVIYCRDNVPGVSKDLSFAPLGMESTRTGRISFWQVRDFEILFDLQDIKHSMRNHIQNYGFVTVGLGLCEGMLIDIRSIVRDKNLSMSIALQSMQQQIQVLTDLWQSLFPTLMMTQYDQDQSHRLHRVYSELKRLLIALIGMLLEIGDSRHTQAGPTSQRFRDALTYTSHRQNYVTSLSSPY
jgi:hypothetical protein